MLRVEGQKGGSIPGTGEGKQEAASHLHAAARTPGTIANAFLRRRFLLFLAALVVSEPAEGREGLREGRGLPRLQHRAKPRGCAALLLLLLLFGVAASAAFLRFLVSSVSATTASSSVAPTVAVAAVPTRLVLLISSEVSPTAPPGGGGGRRGGARAGVATARVPLLFVGPCVDVR